MPEASLASSSNCQALMPAGCQPAGMPASSNSQALMPASCQPAGVPEASPTSFQQFPGIDACRLPTFRHAGGITRIIPGLMPAGCQPAGMPETSPASFQQLEALMPVANLQACRRHHPHHSSNSRAFTPAGWQPASFQQFPGFDACRLSTCRHA